MENSKVLALAGGVGGAKLALGLRDILDEESLAIVVNTGDDEEFFGLHVSPALDPVLYTPVPYTHLTLPHKTLVSTPEAPLTRKNKQKQA